ncbi:MAG: prolyl aminopeptidase [Proteobacteria bacterium]|nr:prolyl aminopeptidase [Pseudomonadota bacterium]
MNGVLRDSQNWLYPASEPFNHGHLDVGDGHKMYFEESGCPGGKPVVFVHGGPGGGTSPEHRRFFDPRKYRIVLFDQRGCGKSTPHASIENNTTWHLVADMEALRRHLKIATWQVFGGSWGSTLALTYSIKHPTVVSEIVLRGIFLVRQKELKWFYQEGTSELFPDAWEDYLKPIPRNERHDLIAAYHKRLTSSDRATRIEACKAWSLWEGITSNLFSRKSDVVKSFGEEKFAEAFARIESHYFVNKGFYDTENWILDNCSVLVKAKIPTVIVQGRYDVVCPMTSAWELHKAMPHAELFIVSDAGHSAFEPGISRALVSSTDKFAHS